MKNLLPASVALALTLPIASAQTWSKTFTGFNYYHAIAAAGDEAWVASGAALLHLGADGSVLGEWTSQPYATDIQVRANGGKVLCGAWGGWVASYDAGNQLEWGWHVDSLGYWEYAHFYGLDLTTDGGVIAIGNRWFTDVAYEDDWGELMLYRFAPDGTVLWSLRAGDFADMKYTGGTDVEELADGSFFFVGRGGYFPDMVCGRVSAAGQLLWLDEVAGGIGWSPQVALLADGDLMAIDSSALVLRMNPDGDVAWKQELVGTQGLWGLAATADGGAVATGYNRRPDSSALDLLYVKLSAAGEIEWQGMQGNADYQYGQDIALAANGDLLIAGAASANYRGIVQRFDAGGQSPGCDVVPGYVQFEAHSGPNGPISEPNGPAPDPLVPYQKQFSSADLDVIDVCLTLSIGTRFCAPAVANSTGLPAELWIAGEASTAVNSVTLVADELPPHQAGYFLIGMGTGVVNPPGSQGNLCLAGSTIYRFASSVKSAGASGVIELGIDLTAIPGLGQIKSGETWNFQTWFRDKNPQSTSNFTDAIAVTFVP